MRYIFTFIILVQSSFATLIITQDVQELNNFSIPYIHDINRTLTLDNILKKDFKKQTNSRFGFGHIHGNLWFKFQIKNETNSSRVVLRFSELWYEEFNLFYKENSLWKKKESGLFVPLNLRDYEDSYPIFNLNIPRGETRTFYIQAYSKLSYLGAFSILSEKAASSYSQIIHLFFYAFYFGGILIVVLLHSFLFFILRERIFAYYIGYVLATAAFVFTLTGTSLYFNLAPYYYEMQAFVPFMMLFLILFSMQFLNIKTNLPKTYIFLSILNILFACLTFILIFFNIDSWIQIMNNIVTLGLLTLLYSGLKIGLQGNINAKIYLFIMVIYVFGLVLASSVFSGDLENTIFNRYFFLLASYMEIGFFSLVLTNKIRRTKELEKAHAQLKEQANKDALTNLYNRRYFSEVTIQDFKISQRYENSLSIVMIDIDDFKAINDTYGHQAGDEVLIFVSNIFKNLTRKSDIVCRYGGEEFIILLPRTSLVDAVNIANKICKEVENSAIEVDVNCKLSITISMGVTEFIKESDTSIEHIIKRADDFLYKAKESGKNCVIST